MKKSPKEIRLLHLSDLHFGPPYNAEVGAAVVDLANSINSDAIVVSGDFTQRATRQQFQDASDFLQRLPAVPRLYIPGNHDVPLYRLKERMRDPHGLYREFICDDLNPVLSLEGLVLVGLDSTSPRAAISNGRIRPWQLAAVKKQLAETPASSARIIVAHHHFAPAPDNLRDRTMPNSKRAMMQFVENDVDMILGGHLHRAYIGNSLDFYPGTHRERGIVIVQCGTTTSRRGRGREREKNSLNLIQITSETMTITHFIYFDEDAGFVPGSRHVFPRGSHALTDGVSTE